MRSLKTFALAMAWSALPLAAWAQQPLSPSDVIDKIIRQEQAQVQYLRQYAPLVETYIQFLREDKKLGAVPDGDKYFLGRAELQKGLEIEPLERETSVKHKVFASWGSFFTEQFLPRGFLQMIFLDQYAFDRQHYSFEYVRREFLGDVRCLVFDVDPVKKNDKGRFMGRIWVEEQDFHIVRFNGGYGGASLTSEYFNFDSWRIDVGKNQWLPAFIYSEEGSLHDPKTRTMAFHPFRAQTRLWGYNLGHGHQEQELNRVLVEADEPVTDLTEERKDYSPMQSERSWDRQAEDNVADRLERQGLLAPRGELDRVLETVANNLAVTNNLDLEPEVRCRVLMTSTLESFTMGHTIVLSRGLVDVLPDEASLAAILAHELGHVVLGHRMDAQFAFLNRVRFDEKETFRHFDFARTPEEEEAAKQKGSELLKNSPYQEKTRSVQLFLEALQNRSKEIPNLISPHLGNRVSAGWTAAAVLSSPERHGKPWAEDRQDGAANPGTLENAENTTNTQGREKPAAPVIAALPLGGRIKLDPWNDQLRMLKSRPVGIVADGENIPFQITPFVLYLTRQEEKSPMDVVGTLPIVAKVDADARP